MILQERICLGSRVHGDRMEARESHVDSMAAIQASIDGWGDGRSSSHEVRL